MIQFNLKIILLILFFSVLAGALSGQGIPVDQPVSVEVNKTVDSLAFELTKNKISDRNRAYAIYEWVVRNISYDFLGVENVTMGFESAQVVKEALEKRKGVCQHYAEVFHALAVASGFKSTVVSGYTLQNGKIDKVPHAWNALMIDTTWHLFDPTWGSGYFDGSSYKQEFRDNYFMVSPDEMIKSHMPFDPLFQFLPNPVSHENFKKGMFIQGNQEFDVNKDIHNYFSLSEEQQVKESMDRVKEFGIANTMVRGYYSNLNRRYNVYVANRQVDLHNLAIEKFNEVVAGYNSYANEMNERGGRFPKNTESIKNQLKNLEEKAHEVLKLFNEIDAPARLALTLSENRKNLEMLMEQIQKEQHRLMNQK